MEEHSLTEGMAEFLPIYKVLGKIPLVRNISNRIVVLQNKGDAITVWSIVALEAVSFTALLTLGAIWAGADMELIVSLVK